MDVQDVLTVPPWVELTTVGQEVTVFDRSTGRALALNSTAAEAVLLMDGHTSLGSVFRALAHRYDVPEELLAAEVMQLAELLVSSGTLRVALGA